jgi:xanthine dehydrogenase YagR molybdenum-binding subunit
VSAVGAYGQGSMPVSGPAKTLYSVPNVLTREEAANTSIGSHAAFRAPGYVEGTTALETAMDELARKVGLDPIEIRLLNRAERDPISGLPYSGNALDQCLKRAAELLGPRPASGTGPRRLGVGIACGLWGAGGGPPAHALVKLNRDGSAVVLTGTQDIGTGTRTVLAQIAAEELGLPLDAVEVRLGDTEVGLHAPFSAGSMTLASMGPAVRLAAADARAKLLAVVSARTGGPGEPLARVLDGLEEFTLTGHGCRHPNPGDRVIKSFAAHAALVEVDVETGEVRVVHYAAVHDIGRVVNPLTATSQVAGGILMGIGFCLMEERVIDPRTGRVLNPNLADYRVMTSADVPRLSIAFIDRPDETANNLGARGLGEPPIIPVAAAIANAVRDAIGVRPNTLPLTPSRILAALGKAPAAGTETAIRPPRPLPRRRARSRR